MKKGFTLVELLTVIALLAIFALVTIPAVDNILEKQKIKIQKQNVETIKDALKLLNNEIDTDDDYIEVTLSELKQEGLIDYKFKNPKTKKCYSNNRNIFAIEKVGESYRYIVGNLIDGTDEDCGSGTTQPVINYAFRQIGLCTFNGTNKDDTNPTSPNITGEECTRFSNSNFINTNTMLFSEENWEKDFDLTVNVDRLSSSSITQAVVVGEMNEVNNVGQTGFVIRTFYSGSNKALEMILRKNAKVNNSHSVVNLGIVSEIEKITLVRRNQKLCYSINDGPFTYAYDYSGFSNKHFDIPVYFGADTQNNSTTDPRRIYNGDLSNMSITFDVDQSITCTN